MANFHLRDTSLSLKAKGLLSLMLSLPETWDYTAKGLSRICKDGVDSICATVKELEKAGYVQRRRLRDELGRLAEVEYTILEEPIIPVPEEEPPKPEKPVQVEPKEPEPVPPQPEAPKRDNPVLDNPVLVSPVLENPKQVSPGLDSPKLDFPV